MLRNTRSRHCKPQRNDIMYPWFGATAGYGTNAAIASAIPMPDFSALGIQRNVDTLDYRTAYGYTYDTIAVIGVGLDRTGSMMGMTPDPMTTGAPDVTKWEAAKRGVVGFPAGLRDGPKQRHGLHDWRSQNLPAAGSQRLPGRFRISRLWPYQDGSCFSRAHLTRSLAPWRQAAARHWLMRCWMSRTRL